MLRTEHGSTGCGYCEVVLDPHDSAIMGHSRRRSHRVADAATVLRSEYQAWGDRTDVRPTASDKRRRGSQLVLEPACAHRESDEVLALNLPLARCRVPSPRLVLTYPTASRED